MQRVNKMKTLESPRLFLGLIGISIVFLLGIALSIFFLDSIWSILSIFLFALLIFASIAIFGIAVGLKKREPLQILQKPAEVMMNLLYPVAMFLGALVLRIDKDKIRRSFISVHNRLAQSKQIKVKVEEILVLLPHCLQWSECNIKITNDVMNCKMCGKCKVGELVTLKKEKGFHLAVATGGTLARKIVKDIRPKAIIGVACERDLVSGIQDVRNFYVIGVTNERPNGPCYNTSLDLEKVREALRKISS